MHYYYKAIIHLAPWNYLSSALLGYVSINVQLLFTQLGYPWNQSLVPKHASVAIKKVGPRTFGLLMWVGSYNNFSREINEMQMSGVSITTCVTSVWHVFEKLSWYVVHVLLSILRRSERFILFTCSKKRAKNQTYSYYLDDYFNFLEKKPYFKAKTALPSPQCPRHYQWDGHVILVWPLELCTANEKKQSALGKEATELMDMVTSLCILFSVLEDLTYM